MEKVPTGLSTEIRDAKKTQLISEYFQVSVGKKTTLGNYRKRGVGVPSAGRSTQVALWHGEEF